MPLGLPNHLTPRNIAFAYGTAAHAIALLCLVVAFVDIVVSQLAFPRLTIWPSLLVLLPFFINLYFLDGRRSVFHAAAYLIVGTACVFWFTVTGVIVLVGTDTSDSFVLMLVKLAMIFVGAGSTARGMALWAVGGFLGSSIAVVVATRQAGGTWVVDYWTIGVVVAVVLLHAITAITSSRAARVQPRFARAERDEHLAAVRFRIEAKAAAIMHDTVLGHLAAIASSGDTLSTEARARMTRDLEVLLGEEWLVDADVPNQGGAASWRDSALLAVVEDVRSSGLTVEVSGDVSAISRLGTAQATAVALAAKQCLVNVIRHSGVTEAELVVYGSADEVSVMVVDAGRGFSVAETGEDRLGLRQSVRSRIEGVDGAVQVWSTPGRGTSVMIRVPSLERSEAVG